MKKYYVNKNTQSSRDHEVHEEGCKDMPSSKIDLGYHYSCKEAVSAAKKIYANSDGCKICSPSCHTS